ncbi:MAG: winged helix-turn-helix transcriptional regulator [Ignavibacteriae bacterium]|nr:winged helix-turn-helix transcriptional regulator [Ignavibacteriota bacterium]
MKNLEKRILTEAITSFEIITELRLTPFVTKGYIKLELKDNDFPIAFNALIVPVLNKTKIGEIQKQLNQLGRIPILISRFINKKLATLLKDMGINFIDTVGNTLIKVPPLFIFIKGNRQSDNLTNKFSGSKKAKYKTAALQLIFSLLCNPGLERNPYREIAGLSNIALGTVQIYMRQLENDGFIIRRNRNVIELLNKEKLFHLWVEDYPQQIKAKNIIGRYEIKNQNIDIEDTLEDYNALLGGETAAAKITNYIRPFIHTVYIRKRVGEFILRNRLMKRPNGDIELMKKFWNFDDENSQYNLVPNILIYADLISTNDQRNIETANIIYETKIVQHLR